jgi:fibronectin-binding autotransporter adhesin
MAVKTWTGAGANENWNTGGNWSGGTIPAAGDDIIFDGVAPNGNKNCTLNVGFNALSANFTGYTGTFTFGASFTITSGTITLGSGSSYATNATPTSYTLTVAGTNPGLVSNNKILPVNLLVNLSGSTFTLTGNADFQGNLTAAATGHNIKAATGTTVDLRTGGNITLGACNINTTDHVTIKGYGTSRTYSSNSVCFNVRASFVSGSTYTSLGNAGLAGTSFLTVESGGQFNAVSTHSFSNGGNLTVSGFNASNNSDFYGYTSGSLILANDTVIKSFITIQATTIVITSVGSAKLLLEGNFIATGGGNCTIDRLEFSGTTASNITAVTASKLICAKRIVLFIHPHIRNSDPKLNLYC